MPTPQKCPNCGGLGWHIVGCLSGANLGGKPNLSAAVSPSDSEGRWGMKWQPIETAPNDGKSFLAWAKGFQYVMRKGPWGVHLSTGPAQCLPPYQPTHWMPLPDPPTTAKDDAKGGV